MGICYGMQLLNFHFDGTVEHGLIREDGQQPISLPGSSKVRIGIHVATPNSLLLAQLFEGISSPTEVLLTHGDSVKDVADGFSVTATSGNFKADLCLLFSLSFQMI